MYVSYFMFLPVSTLYLYLSRVKYYKAEEEEFIRLKVKVRMAIHKLTSYRYTFFTHSLVQNHGVLWTIFDTDKEMSRSTFHNIRYIPN